VRKVAVTAVSITRGLTVVSTEEIDNVLQRNSSRRCRRVTMQSSVARRPRLRRGIDSHVRDSGSVVCFGPSCNTDQGV